MGTRSSNKAGSATRRDSKTLLQGDDRSPPLGSQGKGAATISRPLALGCGGLAHKTRGSALAVLSRPLPRAPGPHS